MPEQRVAVDLSSTDPAIARLERHGYVNLINVIHAELQLVERMIERPGSLRSAIHLAEAASRAFKESRVARRHLAELSRFADLVESDLTDALTEAGDIAKAQDVREACSILLDVLPDAHLRVQEVIARHEIPRPSVARDAPTWRRHLPRVDVITSERSGVVASAGSAGSRSSDERPAPDDYPMPVGLERALRALTDRPSEHARITEVTLRFGAPIVVTAVGTSEPGYFEPAFAGLRPSELHTVLEARDEPMRAVLLLGYICATRGEVTIGPAGSATATESPGGVAGEQRVGFELRAVVPAGVGDQESH